MFCANLIPFATPPPAFPPFPYRWSSRSEVDEEYDVGSLVVANIDNEEDGDGEWEEEVWGQRRDFSKLKWGVKRGGTEGSDEAKSEVGSEVGRVAKQGCEATVANKVPIAENNMCARAFTPSEASSCSAKRHAECST